MAAEMLRASNTAVIIVGGDALALSTAREICALPGHRVTVLWTADVEFAREVEAVGATFLAGRPERSDSLKQAGVHDALTILVLSSDDQLNLQAALRARDANPRIRIVLRQFNRTLAAKIEQNLPDCSVLSLAWHSAGTYAAVALDPSCFSGLQFPEPDGPLTGFVIRLANDTTIAGRTVAQAEHALGARIVAVDGDTAIGADCTIPRGAKLVIYGTMARLLASSPRQPSGHRASALGRGLRALLRLQRWRIRQVDPILGSLLLTAIGIFAVGTWHFRASFGSDWLTAAYFVLTTMTTTGYGDLAPDHSRPGDIVAAMVLMLSGIVFIGVFIAAIASRLTRAQWVRMQGLRRIRRHGHIIVCGAGDVGSGVIGLLLDFDKPLVVVESNPDTALVERARDQGFDLLTGDASRDDTLDLCNLGAAHSLVALTNVDTLNLEIALGARARNPDMPVVLRIAEATFAASIANHFDLQTTFSVAALAAPAFASLSRLDGARGRITIGDREFSIVERIIGDEHPAGTASRSIPIAAARDQELVLVHGFEELQPGDRVLIIVPLAPLHDAKVTVAAVAEPAFNGRPGLAAIRYT